MQNLGFVYELYMFLIHKKMLSIVFPAYNFALAWVTDDPMGQGYFTD